MIPDRLTQEFFILYLPCSMVNHWAHWVIFERKKIHLHLICFKLLRKLDVWSLQRLTLPFWMDFIVLVVRAATMWSYFCYSLVWLSSSELEFLWDIPQNMEWTKYLWGKYSLVRHLVSSVAQDISNLGYFSFPHEWSCGIFITKHHIILRWDMTSCWV